MQNLPRLPRNADSREEVFQYYKTRARQLLLSGYIWTGTLLETDFGFVTEFFQAGRRFQSIYVLDRFKGSGKLSRYLANTAGETPVVTMPDCGIESYLKYKQVPYVVAGQFFECAEYRLIQEVYGDTRAARSNVLYMNHIDEGLVILKRIGASREAMKAFCLHPIVQSDPALKKVPKTVKKQLEQCNPWALMLAMEYRSVANEYLAHRDIQAIEDIRLSPLRDVQEMLVADKVQNRKDFLRYHRDSHPRAAELADYFVNWLQRLGITEDKYQALIRDIPAV